MRDAYDIQYDQLKLQASTSILIQELLRSDLKTLDSSNFETLWDIFEVLPKDKFDALRNSDYFVNWLRQFIFKKTAHDKSTIDEAEIGTIQEEGIIQSNFDSQVTQESDVDKKQNRSIPLPATRFDEADLPIKYIKLFKRLKKISSSHSSFFLGDCISDVLALTATQLSDLPGVGINYVQVLIDLKTLYRDQDVIQEQNRVIELSAIDVAELRLHYVGFTKDEIKVLNKLDRNKLLINVRQLLDLRASDLRAKDLYSKVIIEMLSKIQDKLRSELHEIATGNCSLDNWESDILVVARPVNLSVEKFDQFLLEDIDRLFDKLSETELDVIQKRWGFVEDKRTLEDIGESYDLTRERVRQVEVNVVERLFKSIRFSQEFIWELIEPELAPNFPERMEGFFQCFDTEKNFYEILGVLCGKNGLEEYIRPNIKPDVLNSYFAENGGPIIYDDVKEYLLECELENVKNIDNAILYLEQQNRIRIEDDCIWPLNLRKPEAAAFALANHPSGLPWLDIAKHVNRINASRTDFSEHRIDAAALYDSEYIYLSGVGTHRHVRFIDFDQLSVKEIFDELLSYMVEKDRDVFHLNECYQFSTILQKQNYHVVRHIVKSYGEEFGFYFDGRSSSDSVGLEIGFKRITQKNVILEALQDRKNPLTKTEVAALLKSKSIGHASFYLNEMLGSGEVVQVDRMLYTVPEQAYRNIDIGKYVVALEKLLIEEKRPVDPSYIEVKLNERLSENYSKYFYASIAKLSALEKDWFRRQNLYAVVEIPYRNLHDAVETVCIQDKSIQENVSELQRHIAITKETAATSIRNWRNQLE